MLEPHYIALVRNSFDKVFGPDGDAEDIFCDRLFALAPPLRPLFDTDMPLRKSGLVPLLARAVAVLDDPHALREQMAELAVRHGNYTVPQETFSLVGAALLYTVKTRLGRDCDSDLEEAWTVAYAGIATELLDLQQRDAAE